jgi:hypothetical protein
MRYGLVKLPIQRKIMQYKNTSFTVKVSKKGDITLGDPKPPPGEGWVLLSCLEGPPIDQWTKTYVAVWEKEE